MPISAAPESPIKPVYNTPDLDEPELGRSPDALGTVIGASVVVVVVVVVEVVDVVVVVSGAIVVADGAGFFLGAAVVEGAGAVVVVGIDTEPMATSADDLSASGSAT